MVPIVLPLIHQYVLTNSKLVSSTASVAKFKGSGSFKVQCTINERPIIVEFAPN